MGRLSSGRESSWELKQHTHTFIDYKRTGAGRGPLCQTPQVGISITSQPTSLLQLKTSLENIKHWKKSPRNCHFMMTADNLAFMPRQAGDKAAHCIWLQYKGVLRWAIVGYSILVTYNARYTFLHFNENKQAIRHTQTGKLPLPQQSSNGHLTQLSTIVYTRQTTKTFLLYGHHSFNLFSAMCMLPLFQVRLLF